MDDQFALPRSLSRYHQSEHRRIKGDERTGAMLARAILQIDFSLALLKQPTKMDRYRYRAYLLNKNNKIRIAVNLYCIDDDDAQMRARRLVDGHDVELWKADRKIAHFSHGQ